MNAGPAPRSLDDALLSDLLSRRQFGTLASVRRSGHPHLTTVLYRWDPDARIARMATTADRVKVAHLRRDPRAALHVQGDDVLSFAVAEGEAELSGVTAEPGDAVGRELLTILDPGDADEHTFAEALVVERRLVIRLRVNRLYGTVLG